MKAAIQLLAELGRGKRSIAALGDMLELGADTKRMHREVGAFLAGQRSDICWLVVGWGGELAEGARQAGMPADRITEHADAQAAATAVARMVRQGDVVLVKASRGMRMEQVVDALTGLRRVAQSVLMVGVDMGFRGPADRRQARCRRMLYNWLYPYTHSSRF